MNTSIYIPKKICVGYNKRENTYTKKLAYVIYYDEKNKLRKQTSWDSWRDQNIEPDDFDNEPTTGFVLNKHAGGVENSDSHWDVRKSYIRVYDPRGFEFEITVSNLLYILENTSSIKGKGLEGEFVYGWDGKELVLIPVDAPEYQDMKNISTLINNNTYIKSKDLILGATYIDKNNKQYIYMGRFDKYEYPYSYYQDEYKCVYEVKRNQYWFFPVNDIKNIDTRGSLFCRYDTNPLALNNISKKFVQCVDNKCNIQYDKIYSFLTTDNKFCALDSSKTKKHYLTFDELNYIGNMNRWARMRTDKISGTIQINKIGNQYRIFQINSNYASSDVYIDCDNRVCTTLTNNNVYDISEIYTVLNPFVYIGFLENGCLSEIPYGIPSNVKESIYEEHKGDYDYEC